MGKMIHQKGEINSMESGINNPQKEMMNMQALLPNDSNDSTLRTPSETFVPRSIRGTVKEETRQQAVEPFWTSANVHQIDTSRCDASFSDASYIESEADLKEENDDNNDLSLSEQNQNVKRKDKILKEDGHEVDDSSVVSFTGSFHSLLANDDKEDIISSERSASVMSKMRHLTAIASLGGFLSGYNTGVISGAMLPVQRRFELTREQEELVVTCAILSAFFSSLLGGTLNQAFGRKKTILGAAAVFVVGAVILLLAQNLLMLVLGEIALGLGIGLESLTSPMYIAEMAKPSIRGRLVSMYALLMCFGQVFAGIVDGSFSKIHGGWRYMFGFATIPGSLMFFGFLSLPESPAFLASKGSHLEAKRVLSMLRDSDRDVQQEMEDIKLSLRMSSGITATSSTIDDGDQENGTISILGRDENINGFSSNKKEMTKEGSLMIDDDFTGASSSTMKHVKEMFSDASTRKALTVGCGLMVLQQICGPNAVLYYAASIYEMAQFDETTSIWLSAFTAAAQIVGLAFSVYLVESVGRRMLVLSSLTLVALSSLGLGCSFYLARTSSEPVQLDGSDLSCRQQRARIWNGITSYCYDCVQIPGCGYCDGSCVKGNLFGPNESNVCPIFQDMSQFPSQWTYSTCANPDGWMSVLFMVLFLLFFGIGMGGLPWTYNSEIYPVKYRSLAVGISTTTNWIGNLIISSTFLTLSSPSMLYSYGSFYLYSSLSFVGVIWLYIVMPETKGLTLEEIQFQFDHSSKSKTKETLNLHHHSCYKTSDRSNGGSNAVDTPVRHQSNHFNVDDKPNIYDMLIQVENDEDDEKPCEPRRRMVHSEQHDIVRPIPTNAIYVEEGVTNKAPSHSYGTFVEPPTRGREDDPKTVSPYEKCEQHSSTTPSIIAVVDDTSAVIPPPQKCVFIGIAA